MQVSYEVMNTILIERNPNEMMNAILAVKCIHLKQLRKGKLKNFITFIISIVTSAVYI